MNDIQLHEITKRAVKAKFHGHSGLKGKTIPRYPDTAERELRRVTNGYMKLLNKELKARLPELMREYKRERHGDSRMDDAQDFGRKLRQIFQDVSIALEREFGDFGLADRIEAAARLTRNSSLREWKRAVKNTLGVNLLDDYYSADFYEQYLRKWVDENVLKIKSIPGETLDNMRQIILDGYLDGKTMRDLQADIQNEYNVSKHKAQMLARDQIATLNSQITQAQQRDAGCKEYTWSTSKDSRVRECHQSLDGKRFSWDDPPEMWYRTKKDGIVFTGRRCHPGEDYCCRCVAIPYFDIDTLSVPMAGDDK